MAKVTDLSGRPHSGLVPHAVIGLVTDNVDPDELGRVQVKFPTLHDEPVSFWLRQISPNAGAERGLYALPEIDDEVLVLFVQGSHDVGVIIGQFWNGVDVPPAECKDGLPGANATKVSGASISKDTFTDGTSNLDKNDRRFWKSRAGHLLVFDDSDGKESVQIWDKEHKLSLVFDSSKGLITLANTDGDLHIRTGGSLFLEAGKDLNWYAGQKIVGESGMDTTHKAGQNYKFESGMNAEMKAGMAFKIEAQTDFSVKANVNCKLEGSVNFEAKGGAMAKVEGSAMLTLKGGMVMIN